jgi:hypothetical protein
MQLLRLHEKVLLPPVLKSVLGMSSIEIEHDVESRPYADPRLRFARDHDEYQRNDYEAAREQVMGVNAEEQNFRANETRCPVYFHCFRIADTA